MTDTSQDNSDTGTDGATDTGSAIGDAVNDLDNANDDGDKSGDGDAKDDADKSADGDKDADAKADKKDGDGDDAGSSSGAPDEYDTSAFKMPEGVEFDTEGFEAVEPVLRELDLDQGQAGKLMEAYGEKIVPMIEARTEKRIDDLGNQLKADMAKDLHADDIVGGDAFEESKALTARAIQAGLPDKDGREQFTKFLSESGMGNNRFLMRILTNAGREMGEAGTPSADGNSSGTKTTAEKFYG